MSPSFCERDSTDRAQVPAEPDVKRPDCIVYIEPVSNPADAGVLEAIGLLARREMSSRELVEACLERIRERDGTHSHDGDPSSVNAWVRVYEDDALAAADRADARRAAGDPPPLCGIPIGLKDLYAVAGKPLTASSSLLDDVPARSCDAWRRLEARRDGVARPPAHARVRGRRDDRPGRQSVGARPLCRRLERRLGGGARGADDARGDRHRHGGLAAHSVGALRHLDDQADARPRADARDRAARADARPRRADGAHRRRLRAAARRARRLRARRCSGRRCGASRSRPDSGWSSSTPTWPTASTPRSTAAARSAPSSSTRRHPTSTSSSASRSSTWSAPGCSSTTAGSTTGGSSTARRSAGSSSTARPAR